jgi:probable rRNA maturation factor
MRRPKRRPKRHPKAGPQAALRIEVIIGSPQWSRKRKAASLVKMAVRTASKYAARSRSTPAGELAILLTNDSAIRALNHDWRKRNAPTNVLSFPARPSRPNRGLPRHLGDIAIAYETTAREAADQGKSFDHHLVHLAVHGFLHLLGHDHTTDHDADRMERLEVDILARLAVPNPYALRGVAG